jgi:hypothetical protein
MSGILQAIFADQRSFAAAPGAPTIGTATATGSTTATVSFTAPASNGGSTITSYTATSSPGGITGTLSQSGSGTITVTGLSGVTSYTFTVTATNAIGTGPSSAASNSITTSRVLGSAYGGGFFAGQISTSADGVATHNLVVCDVTVGENTSKQWKTTQTSTSGTSSIINGPANSANMNNADHPAAQFCEGINTGGFTDWYMPAQNELDVCFYRLKPTSDQNAPGIGANIHAVSPQPYNTNHGSFDPTITTATNFRYSGGAQAFSPLGRYWASTEVDATTAICTYFDNGYPDNPGKQAVAKVRAIRRVPV